MKTVRPKPLSAPLSSLPLSPEEGFVLSRIDGRLSVRDLVALTGLEEARLEQIVTKLATHGAIALEGADLPSSRSVEPTPHPTSDEDSGTTSLADFAAALGMDPTAFAAAETGGAVERLAEDRVATPSETPDEPVEPEEPLRASEPTALGDAADGDPDAPGEEALDDADDPTPPSEESSEAANAERNYRQLYESKFHAQPTDARVHAAQTANGADLLALCFDQEPRVVAAILENHLVGLDHVRLIATHHRTTTGLELVSRRNDFVRDALVERRLLRNPQCGEMVLSRIMAHKRIIPTYKIAIDRVVPALTPVKTRGHLRKKWQTGTPEDRSDLVLRTDARCLTYLTGCTFDAKTTQILCGRTYASAMFVQNIAKFSAAPPALLAHLAKQPFVRKSVPLKRMLLQHPNMPGEVKRTLG